MISSLKKNKLLATVILAYLVLGVANRNMALSAMDNSAYYLIEMLQILPVIFLMTVAIDVLIPKAWIIRRLGERSGFGGALLALAFGSLSAGPIYAAFPIAKTLHKKGASVSNVVIILSAWAVVKVPMLANEAKFLGADFMAARWVLTVAFIFAMGWIMEKMQIRIESGESERTEGIRINRDYCIGCRVCEKTLPAVFRMREGKAHIAEGLPDLSEMDDNQKAALRKISDACPPKAIAIWAFEA